MSAPIQKLNGSALPSAGELDELGADGADASGDVGMGPVMLELGALESSGATLEPGDVASLGVGAGLGLELGMDEASVGALLGAESLGATVVDGLTGCDGLSVGTFSEVAGEPEAGLVGAGPLGTGAVL
ncbi:MAG TPA: hypothetical protein VHM70_01535 [Polyangiaceae bacterium]|jgi:hypothetical protein|nr:hypothetical protein [Polyangiaceae bacterium]